MRSRFKANKRIDNKLFRFITIIILSLSFIFTLSSLIIPNIITASENNTEWQVELYFTEPDETSDTVTFGVKNEASDGKDIFDTPKPPAPQTPYIRAWFTTSLDPPYNMLWEEYKSSSNNDKIWNLTVQWISETSIQTNITISWDISDITASRYNSINLVTSSVTDMLVDSNHLFTANNNEPNNFQIILKNKTSDEISDKNDQTSLLIPMLVIIILIIIIIAIYLIKIKK